MKTARADVTGIRQGTQYTCMAASISACISALSNHVTEEDVNKVLGAGPLRGARWEEALATLQYFGFKGYLIVPSNLEEIRRWTDKGNPVIIAWNPEGRSWSHASVVFDVDDQFVYVMDSNIPNPNKTVRTVSHDDFYGKWSEKVGELLVVRRPALFVSRGDLHAESPVGEQMSVTAKKKVKKDFDPTKSMRSVERQKAIESGTYFQTGAGKHKNKKDRDKHKGKEDWRKEANLIHRIALAYNESN